MSTTQTTVINIACDGTGCDKNVSFLATQEGQAAALRDNPWLENIRTIQNPVGMKFTYCSDTCEADGIGKSKHNKPTIIHQGNAQQVAAAAKAQELAAQAQAAMKQGSGIEIVPG